MIATKPSKVAAAFVPSNVRARCCGGLGKGTDRVVFVEGLKIDRRFGSVEIKIKLSNFLLNREAIGLAGRGTGFVELLAAWSIRKLTPPT